MSLGRRARTLDYDDTIYIIYHVKRALDRTAVRAATDSEKRVRRSARFLLLLSLLLLFAHPRTAKRTTHDCAATHTRAHENDDENDENENDNDDDDDDDDDVDR